MSDELYFDDWGAESNSPAESTYPSEELYFDDWGVGSNALDNSYYIDDWNAGFGEYSPDVIQALLEQFALPVSDQILIGDQTVAREEAPGGTVSQQPVGGINAVSQAMTSGAPEKSILERFASALTPTAKTNPYSQISEKDMQAMAPRDRAMFQMLQAQYEAKQPSTFERLLQLGLAGGSALASYSGAQSANKERERIAKLQEQQMADYNAAKQRLNMPGGYASLKPASVAFKPLA
jgi:hypothetical protein